MEGDRFPSCAPSSSAPARVVDVNQTRTQHTQNVGGCAQGETCLRSRPHLMGSKTYSSAQEVARISRQQTTTVRVKDLRVVRASGTATTCTVSRWRATLGNDELVTTISDLNATCTLSCFAYRPIVAKTYEYCTVLLEGTEHPFSSVEGLSTPRLAVGFDRRKDFVRSLLREKEHDC